MKASEFREMSEEELRDQLKGYSEQLFKLRLQQATGQLDNVMKIRQVRRDLARTKTVLAERIRASTK